MAVQKSRKTRSTIGHRRAHNALAKPAIVVEFDPDSGERHLRKRHRVSADGFYRGKQVIITADIDVISE